MKKIGQPPGTDTTARAADANPAVSGAPTTPTPRTPRTGRKRGYHVPDGIEIVRPRAQGRAVATVSPLTHRPPSPAVGRIGLATADDMVGVERIQRQHGFDPDAEDPPPAGGWLLGMPTLLQLQDSADCEQHVWVANDIDDPQRVIGSFAVSAPFTMNRPIKNHKFVVPLPPAIEAAFRTFGIRYVSRVMVDDDPKYARTGIMGTMFSEVLDSDVYDPTPALAHVAIDPLNAASEGFFRAQGWKLIGYTANHPDPARNTGLPVSDTPVIGGLWLLPPPGVYVPEVEGSATEVVERHPVTPGESFEKFVPVDRRDDRAVRTIGGFLEYGSMLREARNFARKGRDKLAQRYIEPGETIYQRPPQPQVEDA